MRRNKKRRLVFDVLLSASMRSILLACLFVVNYLGWQCLSITDGQRNYLVSHYDKLDYEVLMRDETIVNSDEETHMSVMADVDVDETVSTEMVIIDVVDSVAVDLVLDSDDVKTSYRLNEPLDLTNLVVTVVMSDGTNVPISMDECYIVAGDTESYGETVVTVSYQGLIETYNIYVMYDITDVEPVKKYASAELNLRSGPGTEHAILTKIPFNTEVVVTGTIEKWSRVTYNNCEYFCASDYLMDEKYVEPEPIYDGPYDNIVVGEVGTSSSVVSAANDYWNKMVPDSVKKWFVDSGWQLKISKESLQTRFNREYSVAGMTVTGADVVYLDNRTSVISTALLHEVGHAVDSGKGKPYGAGSYSAEFEELWKEEASKFVDCTGGEEYARSTPQEYFASVFANIILSPNTCKAQCPKTYAYVKSYIP